MISHMKQGMYRVLIIDEMLYHLYEVVPCELDGLVDIVQRMTKWNSSYNHAT